MRGKKFGVLWLLMALAYPMSQALAQQGAGTLANTSILSPANAQNPYDTHGETHNQGVDFLLLRLDQAASTPTNDVLRSLVLEFFDLKGIETAEVEAIDLDSLKGKVQAGLAASTDPVRLAELFGFSIPLSQAVVQLFATGQESLREILQGPGPGSFERLINYENQLSSSLSGGDLDSALWFAAVHRWSLARVLISEFGWQMSGGTMGLQSGTGGTMGPPAPQSGSWWPHNLTISLPSMPTVGAPPRRTWSPPPQEPPARHVRRKLGEAWQYCKSIDWSAIGEAYLECGTEITVADTLGAAPGAAVGSGNVRYRAGLAGAIANSTEASIELRRQYRARALQMREGSQQPR